MNQQDNRNLEIDGESDNFLNQRKSDLTIDFNNDQTVFMAKSWSGFKKHVKWQFLVEYNLLKNYKNWIYIVFGLVAVYIHVIGHNLAYYVAEPREPLKDLLFEILPEVSTDSILFNMNTILLFVMYGMMTVMILSIFFFKYPPQRRVSFIGICNRYLYVAGIGQILRVITFLLTVLPAPNPFCREPHFDPPTKVKEIFIGNAGAGDKGCGDLIFSSHTMLGLIIIFIIHKFFGIQKYEYILKNSKDIEIISRSRENVYRTYNDPETSSEDNSSLRSELTLFITKKEYYLRWFILILFVLVLLFDFVCILLSRKHYTVDIVVAIYTTFFIWYIVDKNHTDPKIPNIKA